MKLITYIRDRVVATIPKEIQHKLKMRPLSYEAALTLLNGTCRLNNPTSAPVEQH
jgi:hypothetical protein